MNHLKIFVLIPFLLIIVFTTGCATNISKVSLDTSMMTLSNNDEAHNAVYINSIEDMRVFNTETDDPSQPSLDLSIYDKSHSIGRKRNSFGKAMGGFLLNDKQTVEQLTKIAIHQALIDNGYKIIYNKNDVRTDTALLDLKIINFWTWMKPGFWQIRLNNNIRVNVKTNISPADEIDINGNYTEGFQVGTENNYIKVMQHSYISFYKDAIEKLKKLLSKNKF